MLHIVPLHNNNRYLCVCVHHCSKAHASMLQTSMPSRWMPNQISNSKWDGCGCAYVVDVDVCTLHYSGYIMAWVLFVQQYTIINSHYKQQH